MKNFVSTRGILFLYPAAAAEKQQVFPQRPPSNVSFLSLGAAANTANLSSSLFAAEIRRGGGVLD
jgi:hypothetical protein